MDNTWQWDATSPGIPAMYNSFCTCMVLVLALVLTLWGCRGIKGFCIGFIWHGKNIHDRLRKTGGVITNDDPNICRETNIDDLEHPTFRKQAMNEKGIHTRFNLKMKSKAKSYSLYDSLTPCYTSFIETKMLVFFEKSLPCFSPWTLEKFVPVSPSGNPSAKQQMGFPTLKKWECLMDNFRNTFPKYNQVSLVEELTSGRIDDSIQEISGNYSPSLSYSPSVFSPLLICHVEDRGKWKGNNNHDNEQQKGETMLKPSIRACKKRELTTFENQYGWNKLLSIKSGFAEKHCKGKFRLNDHKFSLNFVLDSTCNNAWQVRSERKPMKLLGLTEDVLSSVDNDVCLWDVQMAKCPNETMMKDTMVIGSHIQDSYEPLFCGIVAREQKASLVAWDSRIFVRPVSFRLGKKPRFHSLQLIDKKFCLSDELNNTMFDLRMFGATPIEVCAVTL